MKKITIVLSAVFSILSAVVLGQGVYLSSSPTDVTQNVTLYVDITSSECNCPELQDADPETNPLYIWSWEPTETRPDAEVDGQTVSIGNGTWDSSNEALRMQQDPENPNIWYYDFLGLSLTEFYGIGAPQIYSVGLSFLIKEKSGAAGASGAEQKSPDIHVVVEPIGCFDKICPFPTTFFQDEYFVITYDNNMETATSMQNMAEGECYIWFRYRIDGGEQITLREETEKFLMDYEGDGIFTKSMIPQEFFDVPQGQQLTELEVVVTKSPVNVPPFAFAAEPLVVGCQ